MKEKKITEKVNWKDLNPFSGYKLVYFIPGYGYLKYADDIKNKKFDPNYIKYPEDRYLKSIIKSGFVAYHVTTTSLILTFSAIGFLKGLEALLK